jgi:hypothetical protein
MNNREQKLSLLSEMIAFSIVDGQLHQKEYDFIFLIACELKIDALSFDHLFHEELIPIKIKNEQHRIEHFYRLALLMCVDGVLRTREMGAIHGIGLKMGLNPKAMDFILDLTRWVQLFKVK